MKKTLSNEEIATLCLELSYLYHGGKVSSLDLEEMAKDGDPGGVLTGMAQELDNRSSLAEAMERTGAFPDHVLGLVEAAEATGHEEKTLMNLSNYYKTRVRLNSRIRNALLYPAVMLALMLVVIGVLLVKVLPIFDDVYASLGGRLTGVAGGLLTLGRWMDQVMPVLWAVLIVLAVFAAAFAASESFRGKILSGWKKSHGDKGISQTLNNARFIQALAMHLACGKRDDEALEDSGKLFASEPKAQERCQGCLKDLKSSSGEIDNDLSDALFLNGFLTGRQHRFLKVAMSHPSAERDPMQEIAEDLNEEGENAIEALVSRVEPALVLVCSILVGLILLSVMLPLMHIMAAIG